MFKLSAFAWFGMLVLPVILGFISFWVGLLTTFLCFSDPSWVDIVQDLLVGMGGAGFLFILLDKLALPLSAFSEACFAFWVKLPHSNVVLFTLAAVGAFLGRLASLQCG